MYASIDTMKFISVDLSNVISYSFICYSMFINFNCFSVYVCGFYLVLNKCINLNIMCLQLNSTEFMLQLLYFN